MEPSLSGSTELKNNYSGKTILLVEDEVLIAMNEAEMLESYGFRVISAASAEDAIAAVREKKIDLILMDIDLGHGDMDGTEAAEIILEDHDIPVVFLSSHTEPEIVEKTENITSYGYVVKNSGETVIIASIKMAFRLHDAYQKRIEKSNQLDTLLDNAEDFIGRLDRHRAHLYVNRALCDAVGIPFEEYVGKTIEELGYPPELSEKWNKAVDSVFETGKPAQFEFSFPGTDGDRVLDCRIVPEIVQDSDVHTVVAISRDVTEQKQTEEALKKSQDLFYKAFQSGPLLMTISTIDNGTYLEVNRNFTETTGFTKEDVIGKTSTDIGFISADERSKLKKNLLTNGRVNQLELPLKKKSGEKMHCLYFGEIIEVNGAKRLLSLAQDITEQNKVFERIRESEKKLKYFVENTNDWVWQVDIDGRYTYSSPSAVNIIGFAPNEICGKTPFDFMEDDEVSRVRSLFTKIARRQEAIRGLEDTMIHKEGRKVIFETNATPVFDDNGSFRGYFGTCKDITERKTMEKELQQREVIFNEAQEIAHVGSFVWDLRDDSLEWSSNMYNIAGIDPDNFYGNLQDTINNGLHPDDRESIHKEIAEMIERKRTWPMQFRFVRPDGQVRVLRSGSRFIFDENGTPIICIGVHHDITDQTTTVETLRKSEEKYRAILETTMDGFWVADTHGVLLEVNDAYCQKSGYSREELLSLSVSDVEAEENSDEVQTHIKKVIQKGSERFESIHRRKDGSLFNVEVSTTYISLGQGMFVSFFRDITKRKLNEDALRESEEKFRALYDNVPLPYQSLDKHGRFLDVNPAWLKVLGYDREEVIGEKYADFLHPDWRAHFEKNFPEFKKRGYVHDVQFRIRHKNGHYLDISFEGCIGYDSQGTARQTYCVFHDITDRKKAEDERRLNEARLESLLKLHDMTEATEKELAQIVLEESERLTQSEIGFINYLSEDETMVTHAVYTANTLRQCTLPDNVSAFKISACGLWSEAYRQRRPIIMNDYTMEHAAKVGFPEGHPVLRRFISIPVFKGDHVVAVAALGNKKTDYNQGDVRQFRLFMEGLWQTIQRREAEEKFKAIADYSYDWEDWISPDRKLIWINPAVERITGYTPKECYRMPDYPFPLVHEGDRETVRAELVKSLEEETSIQNREFRCLCKDGTQTWISVVWQPIYDTADNFKGLRSSLRVINEQKEAENNLLRAVEEKDYLMGEINHRVKNNLAIISSLIHLKDSALGDTVDLSDIENQITAISLVHEKLYKSESITHIEFKDYIQDLLTTVFSSFTKKRVAIENSIGDISLPTKTAVTLGLIINEIATNAIKYGFTSDSETIFTVAMEKDTMEQRYILTLANTGNPFPPEVDLDHPTTLGLRLISALVGQLKGRIELERTPHPVFTFRFPES